MAERSVTGAARRMGIGQPAMSADGKIAERWATVTPMHELAARTLAW